MEKKLRKLFDYQRFSNNKKLAFLINDTLSRYFPVSQGELSDDDVDFLNAAGTVFSGKSPK